MKRPMMLGALALVATQANAQPRIVDPLASVNGTVRVLDDSARDSAREANERLSRRDDPVTIDAGAVARADRGTRCYADADAARADPYDPVYRDGAYYCERTGPGVRARAKVKLDD